MCGVAPHDKESEPEWWKDAPRRVSIGRGKFLFFLVLVSGLAFDGFESGLFPPYVGGFVLGLFVIAVLRHNARASGSRSRWRIWSTAWIFTWSALGALSLALGWGSWLGYGAFAIALVALMRFGPQRDDV